MSGGIDVGAARRTFVRACVVGAAIAAVVFTWMLAIGRLDFLHSEGLSGFYDAQAHALLDGHWDIPTEKLGFESYLIDGKTYTYFGPWPALLRLPIAAVTDRFDGRLTQLSMLAAFAVVMVFTGRLLWRVRQLARPAQPVTRREAWFVGGFVAVVGAGSVVMFLASRPVVYHEAELWGAALALASFEATLGFVVRPSRATLVWASILAALSLLSRGSVGIAPIVALGLVLVGRLLLALGDLTRTHWPRRLVRALGLRDDDRGRGYLVALLVAISIPVLVYMWVNWVKFGDPWNLPIGRHHTTFTDEIRRRITAGNDGSLLAMKYIPTDLLAMLRPDAIALDGLFPFLTFPAAASVVGNVTFAAIDPSSSIPASMPFLFLLGIVGLVVVIRPPRDAMRTNEPSLAALRVLVVGGVAGGISAVALPYINHRYMSDFLPLLVVLGAAGLYGVLHGLERLGPKRQVAARVVLVVLAIAAGFSLWANFALALLYQREYSPFPANTERAAFVRFQHELDDLLPGGPSMDVRRGTKLTEPLAVGTVFVLGNCDGVYWSDSHNWLPIEQTHATGRFPVRLTLRDRPPGTRETLLVAGPDGQEDRLDIVFGRDHKVRFEFHSSRLAKPLVGDAVPFEPGRPGDLEILYDAVLGNVSVTLDGRFSLGFGWAADASPITVVGDGTRAAAVLSFSGDARLVPTPARFCRDLVG